MAKKAAKKRVVARRAKPARAQPVAKAVPVEISPHHHARVKNIIAIIFFIILLCFVLLLLARFASSDSALWRYVFYAVIIVFAATFWVETRAYKDFRIERARINGYIAHVQKLKELKAAKK